MQFSTALRSPVRRQLERLGEADILIGIPCFNNQATIGHVVKTIEQGLHVHYKNLRCVVLVSDGGSVDDTREEAEILESSPWIERIIMIYRGLPGKGSAVRAVFEAANILDVKACLMFDSDLRSITPEWIARLVDPVLNDSFDFIAPYYKRYKYDGTITNNIVYNLTRTLYGYRVRQPIGGDFAFSLPLVKKFIGEDVWFTDVARFGIDIWLTITAMVNKAKIGQANLGVKIHDVKDPAEALGPMFRQVVMTFMDLMVKHEKTWKVVRESQPVPVIGNDVDIDPQPFSINISKLVNDFKTGFTNYSEIWKKIILPDNFEVIEKLYKTVEEDFLFPTEVWAKMLYDLAAAYPKWTGNRSILVSLMTPLYFARIASFVNRTKDMSNEEAEAVVEEQAEVFEKMKDYLIQRWEDKAEIC
ncbi:MAG: glycosyltransferase [Spirochaetes bacterium]|nr:glycosyltransferase [Spirochaetota bacterium]